MANRPKVVIIGGGFGGLWTAGALKNKRVDVTLIDRKNHHVFQPLLYQVATAVLSPGEIAQPIRRILHNSKNIEVILGEVTDFNVAGNAVILADGSAVPYDYLIVAAGARHSYFGHDNWETAAPGLKTVEDALEMRRRILLAFELAEREAYLDHTMKPLTFVVVGGGPTGVELAGAIGDIARTALKKDFKAIDTTKARVILFEGADRVLGYRGTQAKKSIRPKEVIHFIGISQYVNGARRCRERQHRGRQRDTNEPLSHVEPPKV
jgi:NADH dehydrogenase